MFQKDWIKYSNKLYNLKFVKIRIYKYGLKIILMNITFEISKKILSQSITI